jgi:heme oxygenase
MIRRAPACVRSKIVAAIESATIDLRATLRERTRDLHAALDAALAGLHDDPTLDAYARHLSRMAAWLTPVEPAIRGRLAGGRFDEPLLERSAWLRDDLTALGLAIPGDAPARALPLLECDTRCVPHCDATTARPIASSTARGGRSVRCGNG